MAKKVQTKSELSRELKLSRQSLYQHLHKEGAPKKGPDGYDVGAVASFVKDQQRRGGDGGKLTAARAAAEYLKCQKLKREIAVMDGILVNRAEITAEFVRWVQTVRTYMLELPTKIAPEVVRLKSVAAVSKVLKAEITKAMEAMSQVDMGASDDTTQA